MIRATRADDLPALKAIIDANGLFASEMLDEMDGGLLPRVGQPRFLADRRGRQQQSGGTCLLRVRTHDQRQWNLYLIAVHLKCQGQGRGTALVRHVERALATRGERVLLVETSSLPDFARTRAFYRKCGYDEEARIRGFYHAGEDKIVFRKSLVAPGT